MFRPPRVVEDDAIDRCPRLIVVGSSSESGDGSLVDPTGEIGAERRALRRELSNEFPTGETMARVEIGGAGSFGLRGWTGEYFQARALRPGDYRVWRPDGSYLGRLIPDDTHTLDAASGIVFDPNGHYVADVSGGRVRVDLVRLRARAGSYEGSAGKDLASPGDLPAMPRSWPRRTAVSGIG
jgi:hypothetical protein